MKTIRADKTIVIPKGIDIQINSRRVTVSGPNGKLSRDFRHLPVTIQKTQNSAHGVKKLEVSLYFGLSKQIAALRSVCSHIDNMITGVTMKYRYAMRLVYAHHPISVQIVNGGKKVEVRNFIGEKVVRGIEMLGNTKAMKNEATKDEIWIEGNDIDDTSRSAALIHQSCLVRNKDLRKFLDGIYVSSHGPVEN
jgi:large subunit ribosomal protein L9e